MLLVNWLFNLMVSICEGDVGIYSVVIIVFSGFERIFCCYGCVLSFFRKMLIFLIE